MKLASYIADGMPAFGVVVGDGVVTMNERLAGGYATLRDAIAGGALDEMRRLAQGVKADHKLAGLRYLPAIPNPEKILCVGINYKSHAAEHGTEAPKLPNIFTRFVNTLVPHEGDMIRPKVSTNFDFEGELALVIGKAGRHIKAERALDHVAGYTCFVDGSVRDYQKFSVTSGKNFPGTGPLGPWLVTTDEIADPTKLTLMTRLNGKEMQRSGTDLLIYSIPQIIAFCSDFTELAPGDVIATGGGLPCRDGRPDALDDPGLHKRPRDLDLPPWQKGRYGTAIGRAVHGVLQTIDLASGGGIAEAVAAQAAAEGVSGHEPHIRRLVEAALRSPSVVAAAAAPHWKELYVGVPVGDSRTLEGYVDLLYRAAGGLVVVDYKTGPRSVDADLTPLVQRYRMQGASYALAIADATREPVLDMVFVFLAPGGAVERSIPDLAEAVAEARSFAAAADPRLVST